MWVLLLRAVNVGTRNRLAMRDLVRVLEGLGHTQVSTLLNSGNATFASPRRSPDVLAREVEAALSGELGLSVQACVRPEADLAAALEGLPDLPGYPLIGFLLAAPEPSAVQAFLDTDWSPDVVAAGDGVVYLGYANGVRDSRMTTARIERALGVGCTARTPATISKLLALV